MSRDALNAGGKRLRPLLVFFATPPDESPSVAAGVAVELVHMATLVHDDLIDGAAFRRGRASAWSAYGPEAARATGDYLFARAFAELCATREAHAVSLLADAALCLARGEAMQRRQVHDPNTTVEAYLERCGLKTGNISSFIRGPGSACANVANWDACLIQIMFVILESPLLPSLEY